MYPSTTLNSRQLRIAQLVSSGLTNREIARAIGTTEYVTKNYLRLIYDKTGMGNRVELALWYIRRSWEKEHEVYQLYVTAVAVVSRRDR